MTFPPELSPPIEPDDTERGRLQVANELLRAERDRYRQQVVNYAIQIAQLQSEKDALTQAHADMCEQLAKMPRTPDGTLVVLGETELYTRSRGEVAECTPWQITRQAGITYVMGVWRDGCSAVTQEVMLSRCYGSEASLLKGETNA